MGGFDDVGSIAAQRVWEGVTGRSVHGERITLGIVELDPGSVVPEHSHEHEQLGLVITGTVTFRIADETRELGPGGTWSIPSNVPHSVEVGPGGAVVIDVFAPTRDDWLGLESEPERLPRWP